MSQKPKPKVDKLRHNVRGEKGFRWDLGKICFDNPGKKKKDDN